MKLLPDGWLLRGGDVAGFDGRLTLGRGVGRVVGRNDAGRDGSVVLRRGGNVTRKAWIGNGVSGVVAIPQQIVNIKIITN